MGVRCVHIVHVDLDCYIKQATVTIIILYRVATELLQPITKVSIACSQYVAIAKTKCVIARGGEGRGWSLEVVREGGGGGGGS